jgi:hypothetical protein
LETVNFKPYFQIWSLVPISGGSNAQLYLLADIADIMSNQDICFACTFRVLVLRDVSQRPKVVSVQQSSKATSSGKGSGSSKQFPATPFFFLPQKEVLVLVVERNFASQNRITSAGYLKMVRYSSLLVYLLVCIEVAIHFSIFNCKKSVYFSLLCFNGVLSFDRKSHG